MNTTTVRCSNGSFIGEDQENIQIWRNIPYAKQPVGPLRWKKPEPAEDDDGTYEAIQPVCIPIVPFTVLEGKVPQGEDCLRLNIYKAKGSDSEKRPDMVWIHGGGFMTESISDPIYDLSKIAVKHPDILFVAVEYRMNIMGFINLEKVPGG